MRKIIYKCGDIVNLYDDGEIEVKQKYLIWPAETRELYEALRPIFEPMTRNTDVRRESSDE